MIEVYKHSPLLSAIAQHASDIPSKVAFKTVVGEDVSYADLYTNILKAAHLLHSMHIGTGDRIVLSAEKEIEFIYLYFASHLIGAVNVVIDAKSKANHIEYICSVTSPKVLFGFSLDGYKSMNYNELTIGDANANQITLDNLSQDDLADIMFTTGTTGNPKGVKLTHYNIFSSASNINAFIRNTHDDVELLALPICHSFGLGRIRCNILLGSTVILVNGFANLKVVFEKIKTQGVTGFGMVPAVWAYIKRFSGKRIGMFADQIKYIEIGSASMPIEDKQILAELFPNTRICMHYGLTEASRAMFMEFHENADDLTTLGKPVTTEVQATIVDGDWNEVKVGKVGEICIKGNMVTSSYLLLEDNFKKIKDGAIRTGDLGYKSSDGKFYIVGREKEIINVGGKKVSPIEIEDALTRIGVGESMCSAIPDPKGVLGSVPKVFLVKGTFTKTIEEIQSELADMLETYKMPQVFEVVDSIPKTDSGKKQRILK